MKTYCKICFKSYNKYLISLFELRILYNYHIKLKEDMGQLQRIQSVYLFLASLVGSSLFALPFAKGPTKPEGILADGYLSINDNIGLIILTVLVVVLSLASYIFVQQSCSTNEFRET